MSGARRWLAVFVALTLPGVIFLLKCPPLWRDYDGLIQIATRPSDMTLLQYPPAYPAFSRMHVYAAQLLGYGKSARIQLRKSVALNDAGIRALIFSQQLALALALTYFASLCTRQWKGRALAVALLCSNATVFLAAQLISTEALSQSLVVAFLALGLHLFLRPKPAVWQYVAYGFLLLLLVLTRHANSVFAGVAPLALLPRWRRAALLAVIGVAAIQAADGVTRLACRAFEVPYRETGMRGPSEKLGFVELMPPAECEAFVQRLQARARDPIVKEAIPLLARTTSWDQQRGAIEAILARERPTLTKDEIAAQADGYLGQVVSAYFRTFDRHLIQDTASNIWRALAHSSPKQIADYYFDVASLSIDLYPTAEWMAKLTRDLESCRPAAKARIAAFRECFWFRLWSQAPVGLFLLFTALAAVAMLWARIGDAARLRYALSLAAIGGLATVLTFVFVHFELRFASTANLLGFLGLALVIGAAFPARERVE